MRKLSALILGCAACTTAPAPIATTPTTPIATKPTTKAPAEAKFVALDLFTALGTETDEAKSTWIAPAPIALAASGTTYELAASQQTPVRLVEKQGNLARVAIRLDTVRFGAWIERGYVLSVIDREVQLSPYAGGGSFAEPGGDFGNPIEIRLHPGARVRRLAREAGSTQVRYYGEIEATGWVPDDALVEEREGGERGARAPMWHQVMMMPGTILRSKPEWMGREMAVLDKGYFLDTVKEIDRDWIEVRYADGDVSVHAYASKTSPPGRRHHPEESDHPVIVTPNEDAPSGTCLYAREDGEPIGYLVGDQRVQLEDAAMTGWFSLAIETPWSGVGFFAKGARGALFACAPAGSVPPPKPAIVNPPPTSVP